MAEYRPHNSGPFTDNLAIVVGINKYQNGISELRTARYDAERFAGILQTKKYGYDVELFIDEQATFNNIWNYLTLELPQRTKPDGNKRIRLLFYFAGHGTPPEGEDGEAGYLLPQDAKMRQRDKWLPMHDIHNELTKLKCHHLLIILDCCYAGAFRLSTRHISTQPEEITKELYQHYLHRAGQVIASTTHNQEALDIINDNRGTSKNSNHSPFAKLLFQALETGDADYTQDGITTVTELNLYLSERLLKLTENQKRPQVSRTWFLPKLEEGEFFFQTGEFDPETLPEAIELNQENNPYRGLKPFEEAHSRFFFGRSQTIQKLQERLNSTEQPLTVVVGISGSGKSSLVKAGLIPKLRENPAQWQILEPIQPGATVFKDLAKASLPLILESRDPDLGALKQIDELLRQARRESPHDLDLKNLFTKWRRTDPDDKLLLLIQHFDRLQDLSKDEDEQQSLLTLRKIGLRRSKLIFGHLDELLLSCNSAEQEHLKKLFKKLEIQIQSWSEAWQQDGNRFSEFIANHCSKDKTLKLLLVIDQFEQLIAQCGQEKRQQFLNALQGVMKRCPHQFRLVLTLRSDFQHYFEDSGQLQDYWGKAYYPLKEMQRDQLRQVIEQPALAQVLYFEIDENGKSLIDQLLDDIGETSGALPLLSFTLSELYYKYVKKQHGDRTLTWEDYNKLGGVTRSLTRRANEEYDNLAMDFFEGQALEIDPSEACARQTMLRWVMLRMVTLEGGEKVKRQVLLDPPDVNELRYTNEETNKRRELVINRFVDARLLVTGTNLESNSYVEPAHDELLRGWPRVDLWLTERQSDIEQVRFWRRFQNWLTQGLLTINPFLNQERTKIEKTEAEKPLKIDLVLQRAVTNAANNYQKSFNEMGRRNASGYLWNGDPRLAQLKQIVNSDDNWLNIKENKFVEASIQNERRNRRFLITGVTIFVLGVSIAGSIAEWQRRNAVAQKIVAQRRQAGQVEALGSYSETLFLNNQQFEALIGNMRAGVGLKDVRDANQPTVQVINEMTILVMLHQLLDKFTESNRLEEHDDIVSTVRVSPDSKLIASADWGGTIKLWSINGTFRLDLKEHNDTVNSIRFSPDGKLLASASDDGTVKLWALDNSSLGTLTGTLVHTFIGHDGPVLGTSFSPNKDIIATSGDDGTIKIWSFDGTLISTFTGHGDGVWSIEFSPDGQTLASASDDNTVKLWMLNGTLLKTLTGHTQPLRGVSFSPDGMLIATASLDQTVKLWNLDGNLEHTIEAHDDQVWGVSFSPDGKLSASASGDGTIKLWNSDGALVETLTGHIDTLNGGGAWVLDVTFSPDGQTIASASEDKTVKLWKYSAPLQTRLTGHALGELVSNVSFDPKNELIASASWDNTAKLWGRSGTVECTFQGHSDLVESVSFSPDGELIASASHDNTVQLWDRDCQLQKSFSGHEAPVFDVSFSPDGQMLASASEDETINLWRIDGSLISALEGHEGTINSVRFSPNGNILASASWDNTVKLWDVENLNGGPFATLDQEGMVLDISFNSDGTMLASVGGDNLINLWTLDGKQPPISSSEIIAGCTSEFPGPRRREVLSVEFSPDSQLIATTCADNTVKLWKLSDKTLLTELIAGGEAEFWGVSFSPDGSAIASGSGDGTIALWNFKLEDLLKRGCDQVRDYLKTNSNVNENDRNLCP